jgi:hypothetical protein
MLRLRGRKTLMKEKQDGVQRGLRLQIKTATSGKNPSGSVELLRNA